MTVPDVRLWARRWASAALPVLLIGCTAVPMAPGQARAQATATDEPQAGAGTSADSQLMFELMIAELAGRRGRLDVALEGYLAAAERSEDPRVAERAARLAIFARQWPTAAEAIGRWQALAPDAVEPFDLLGQVRMRERQPENAATAFATFVERADDQEAALGEVGTILQADPDRETAADVAQRLAERFPDSAAAALGVARMALAGGESERAAEAVERALTLAPGDADALLMRARLSAIDGDIDSALAGLDAAVDADPDSLPLLLGRAQLLVEAGRGDAADEALDAIEPLAAGEADALLTLGLLALERDRDALASRTFEAVLATGQHRDQAQFQLARIADRAGDAETAIERYDAVRDESLLIGAQLRAAELIATLGQVDTARDRLSALSAAVADPAVQARLVTVEGRILQAAGRADDALDVLSAGLEVHPDSGDIRYARALAADAAGQPELLESDLVALIEAEPANAHALNALGYHLVVKDERLDEASDYLEQAIGLLPNDPAIMDSLGWLRFRQGDLEAAIPLLQQAYELLPDPEIAAHLGEALWSAGRQDEARAIWQAALRDAPDHEVLGQTIERLDPA